jgi:hypothetical protein
MLNLTPLPLQEKLLIDIRLAFGKVGRPPDTELFEAREDYLWTECLHGGSGPWWDVPAKAIAHEPHALDELTIAGFCFFLPAYLSWVIRNTRSGSSTVDTAIYALDISGCQEPLLGFRRVRFCSLNSEQHAVVASFLSWATGSENNLDAEAASRALASYWSITERGA